MGAGGDGEGPRQVGLRLGDMMNARQRLEGLVKEFKLYPSIIEQRGMVDAIEEMRKHLQVGVKEGYSFKVSFDAESREQAKNVLDRLLKGIVDDDLKRRQRDAEDAKQFLDAERKTADDDLHTKESALSSFLAQHPQFAAETASNGAAAGGLIRAADRDRAPENGGEVASLELQAAQLEDALAGAGRGPTAAPGEAPIDPARAADRAHIVAEVQAAQRDLADKQARFTNEHPDVKVASRRLNYAEAQLARIDAMPAAPRPAPAPGVPAAAPAEGDEGGGAASARCAARTRPCARRSAPCAAAPPPPAPTCRATVTRWSRSTRSGRPLMRTVGEARDRQNQIEAKQFRSRPTCSRDARERRAGGAPHHRRSAVPADPSHRGRSLQDRACGRPRLARPGRARDPRDGGLRRPPLRRARRRAAHDDGDSIVRRAARQESKSA